MNTRTFVRLGLFAVSAAAACASAPAAIADDGTVQADIGSRAALGDGQSWTVIELRPSADMIAVTPAGSLWEASVAAAPPAGGIPVIPGFSARSGTQSYPVLWTVPTALGVNPAPLAAGGVAVGKLYFDVTGPEPTSVAYSAGGRDMAVWVPPAPPPASAPSQVWPTPARSGSGAAVVAPPVPGAAAVAPSPPVAPTPAPAAPRSGSAGTPVPGAPRSAGTPVPAETGTTPAPAPPPVASPAPSAQSAPAPSPPATPATPAPPAAGSGSAGTPLVTPTTPALASPAVTPAG